MNELTLKEKIESDYYVSKVELPQVPDISEFDKTFIGTHVEYEAAKTELLKNMNAEYLRKYNEYNNDLIRLKAEFKLDLENEFGTDAYPKKDKVFNRAWEDANDSFEDVYLIYLDLVELLVLD